MTYISERFMLENNTAKRLYEAYAKDLPIIDYHCHLKPALIVEDHQFTNITDVWLGQDHYKWRAMRANGVEEKFITGDATNKEKFVQWVSTVEDTIGNPLYHWSHMELKHYFNIDLLCNEKNAEKIWDETSHFLTKNKVTTRSLIESSKVETICTTDSPLSDLPFHQALRDESNFSTKVLPTFRADPVLSSNFDDMRQFIKELEVVDGQKIMDFSAYKEALAKRIDYFHENGCRLSDVGFSTVFYKDATDEAINAIFAKVIREEALTICETEMFQTAIFVFLGKQYHQHGWVMQVHFGVLRNVNKRYVSIAGENSGFDGTNDQTGVAVKLCGLLNALDITDELPQTILYNLDSTLNALIANIVGGFQTTPSIKGKVQFGAAWWFNDTKRGMLEQLDLLASHGLLMNFVGMLTDSRSFLSYTRHDYFRRILCTYIGEKVETGEFPEDEALLKKLVENICYYNAKKYFNFNEENENGVNI